MAAAIIGFHVNCHLNLKRKKVINKAKQANINHIHFKYSTPLESYRNMEFILSFHGHVWFSNVLELIKTLKKIK